MDKTTNLQDRFLNSARKERTVVTVFLINGFQLRGVIAAFDSYMLQLESEGKQQFIYKHAISTITPMQSMQGFPI
jgi:host factor-I protein